MNKVSVFYEKSYTDDTGKHIPELFTKNKLANISIKSYWENVFDGFFIYKQSCCLTCLHGDLRVVIASEVEKEYKFQQFFTSSLDGKIIKVPADTWFAVHNLGCCTSLLLAGSNGLFKSYDHLDSSIFDWNSNRYRD